jgi:hypothetical protein
VAFGDTDLPAFFGDLGVPVVLGPSRTKGLFNQTQLERVAAETGALENITDTTVVVATGTVTGLVQDAAITVDGVAYVVRDWAPLDDGRLTEIRIAR